MKPEIRAIAHLGSYEQLSPRLNYWTEVERHTWTEDDHRFCVDIHTVIFGRPRTGLSVVVEIPRVKK